ncbi:MAG: T9SS type A sorting domain-containing protein [Bacteroidota bacterium]
MRVLLLLFALLALCATGIQAQVVYEDFENGASLNWNAIDGLYSGVVTNPDSNFVNGSDSCGSYTKSGTSAFSLFLAEVATPLDLSTNNEFSIQVYSPVRTSFILKLEGPNGQAIEETKNIANANVWQEYTFDFSAAASLDSLNKIILFFDPGNGTSDDTYLFDNLQAGPAGPCAGTMADPDIIDDFECQRNASYGAGWDNIEAIPNPDPTGINTSSDVGRYVDPQDLFSALVVNYNNPIDLSTKNTFKAKVWAPKTGTLLFKLEGGVSAPAEVDIPVTQTNTWVEYSFDFSSEANANHQSLAIFFNFNAVGDSGDTYYIDDLVREETPSELALEDFEPTAKLTWAPFNNDPSLHGTYTGPIANPDVNGINTSTNVGQYAKGTAAFSTLISPLPPNFSLEQYPQLNLQVKPPAGATEVTIQLSSVTQGIKEGKFTLDGSADWQQIGLDFSGSSNITDFNQINLLFEEGVANSGQVWLFDNLTISRSTVDPCLGVDSIPNILDDFECQRNVMYGAGNDVLDVILNPDLNNDNPSERVGEYKDPADEFSALVLDFGAPIDLSVFNQLNIKIWSAGAVPLLFKLEGGTSAPVEVDTTVSVTNSWQDYTIDFSPYASENHTKIAIFFNAGVANSGNDIYYIDDLSFGRTPFTACISTFESSESTIEDWGIFANGELDSVSVFVIPNPDPSGINTSSTVGVFQESPNGETFAGMFSRTLQAPISLPNNNKTITMKVWSDSAVTWVMKLEQGRDGAAGSGDVLADYTTPNQWATLTWDFSSIPDDALYDRITLIPGFGGTPTSKKTHYFDDIAIAGESCNLSSNEGPVAISSFRMYPNPVQTRLFLEAGSRMQRAILFDMLGKVVMDQAIEKATFTELDVQSLQKGIYILKAIDTKGRMATRKFVKQ